MNFTNPIRFKKVKLPVTAEEVKQHILQTISNKEKKKLFSLDINNYARICKFPQYNTVFTNESIICVDSSYVPYIYKYIFKEKIYRSCLTDIFDWATQLKNTKHLVIGGPISKLRKCSDKLTKTNLISCDVYELPFKDVEALPIEETAQFINKKTYDFIWVSLGAPKQEIYIDKLLPYINCKIICGAGYIIDIYSTMKRAPIFVQKAKLEWFYRLLQAPNKQAEKLLFAGITLTQCFLNKANELRKDYRN